jgi:hypothetical protein
MGPLANDPTRPGITASSNNGVISATDALAQLQLGQLFAQPLTAIVEAQAQLSIATVKFINDFAIDPSTNALRTVVISQDSTVPDIQNGNVQYDESGNVIYLTETRSLNLPFITLLNVPSLQITKFNIDLTVELVSIQDSSSEIAIESVDSGVSSYWNSTGGAGSGVQFYAQSSEKQTASQSASQKITYDVHIEAESTQPPGVQLLLDFLIRNKRETISKSSQLKTYPTENSITE